MDTRLAELVDLLDLERLEDNLFRGVSRDIGSPQVFGGQVLGQALVAASRTVSERRVHSLHAYFLRRGDFNAPIVYQVERTREGGSFTSRRVVAIQHGQPILTMSSSFHVGESGSEHQSEMPEVPDPESLADDRAQFQGLDLERVPEKVRRFFEQDRPFEFRPVRPVDYSRPERRPALKHVWFRLVGRLPDSHDALHNCLLAYVSDYHLLDTANLPHGQPFYDLQMASIDHALWFHRDLRVDDWLLYSIDSPSRSSSRGFARGSIHDRQGRLVASVAQEGLIRERPGGWLSKPGKEQA
jgi:acyl-CoA thioesterase-2